MRLQEIVGRVCILHVFFSVLLCLQSILPFLLSAGVSNFTQVANAAWTRHLTSEFAEVLLLDIFLSNLTLFAPRGGGVTYFGQRTGS